jgi:aconitate hydratase
LKFDPESHRKTMPTQSGDATVFHLPSLDKHGEGKVDRLPYSIRVLLESALRNNDGFNVTDQDVHKLLTWSPQTAGTTEIAFKPARVILQDFTGVPAIVDLAAMRSALHRMGKDYRRINPQVPCDLVVDHSVQVDAFGTPEALDINARREFERNRERYEFLKWGQKAFENFRVVPPATGIVHQVNLEYLARGVFEGTMGGDRVLYPDSLVGTDSHTTMINGLGVAGWGVGGIEAEAVMLGEPIYMVMPHVVGFKFKGRLKEGVTATDLVLTVTEILRAKGVVGKFVEYYGEGLAAMTLPNRATIANMAPEYGATMGYFPVDTETLRYYALTGRDEAQVELIGNYTKEQGMFFSPDLPEPVYSDTVELDLADVEPSVAGPRRPQDRIPVRELKNRFGSLLRAQLKDGGYGLSPEQIGRTVTVAQDEPEEITHGATVIAAITSCTNTSNPSVLIAAGLLAKKAVERGLGVKRYVKTSLAPGSLVVTEYLSQSGLQTYLDKLGFNTVGYGCTTCIGNSGPLPEPVANAIEEGDLIASSVLSGNRNFEGRVHALTKANFLASPPLVVAYALAGTMDVNLDIDPLGKDRAGNDVYLKDVWPSDEEVQNVIVEVVHAGAFRERYKDVFKGSQTWNEIKVAESDLYHWKPNSTYIREPSFFADTGGEPAPIRPISGARVLALLGHTVTTDHISPAGAFGPDSPAGQYLIERGVEPRDFNSFGSRRGNHEVMIRGTFGNIRLRNRLVPDSEGPWTRYFPSDEQMTIYDASMKYRETETPLVVLAGREYGTGSSRDWAAKGTTLLGVRVVLAQSYERIHRSNLVGMGVLPLQFMDGESVESLGLKGDETFDIKGLDDELKPGQTIRVVAVDPGGARKEFDMKLRIDTPVEVEYYRNGGILQTVLRRLAEGGPQKSGH